MKPDSFALALDALLTERAGVHEDRLAPALERIAAALEVPRVEPLVICVEGPLTQEHVRQIRDAFRRAFATGEPLTRRRKEGSHGS